MSGAGQTGDHFGVLYLCLSSELIGSRKVESECVPNGQFPTSRMKGNLEVARAGVDQQMLEWKLDWRGQLGIG